MRAAMMLVLLACIPAPAVRAVPCSGAEQLMLLQRRGTTDVVDRERAVSGKCQWR